MMVSLAMPLHISTGLNANQINGGGGDSCKQAASCSPDLL